MGNRQQMKIWKEITKHIVKDNPKKVLYIGVGKDSLGIIKAFKSYDIHIVGIDLDKRTNNNNYTHITGDFLEYEFDEKFDLILNLHILEHQLNMGLFLDKCRSILTDNGKMVVAVPNQTDNKVRDGHLTTHWNIGQLMYVLVLCKFDVRQGRFIKKGNNIVGIVKKSNRELPNNLIMDTGDLAKLKSYFPKSLFGNMEKINWFD